MKGIGSERENKWFYYPLMSDNASDLLLNFFGKMCSLPRIQYNQKAGIRVGQGCLKRFYTNKVLKTGFNHDLEL